MSNIKTIKEENKVPAYNVIWKNRLIEGVEWPVAQHLKHDKEYVDAYEAHLQSLKSKELDGPFPVTGQIYNVVQEGVHYTIESDVVKLIKKNTGIPTQAENPKGFHQRYFVAKWIPGLELRHDWPLERRLRAVGEAEYFVMRLDNGGKDPEHIKACRIGIHAYANAIEHHLPELAKDLRERYPLINQ